MIEKKTILLGITIMLCILLQSNTVYSMRACDSIQEASVNCQITTPVISCATYDLYNSTYNLVTDDGAMTEIGSTGIYYFTFNQADTGMHKIILCDNTTATIDIASFSNKKIYDDTSGLTGNFSQIQTNLSTIITEVDSTEENQATIAAQITQNTSAITTQGDSSWSTATGFATSVELNANVTTILTDLGAISSGNYDQSIADMLAYNVSDGNTETDLDSAGGTTPTAVWEYASRVVNLSSTTETQIDNIETDTGTTLPAQITQNISTITASVSESDKTDIANKVWTWITGYVDPDSNALNANETLKQIAENTEAGGW